MSRIVMNMDFSWKFHRGEIDMGNKSSHSLDYASCKAGNAKGAAGKLWNDSDWREVDLPHDYYAESEIEECNRHSHGYRREDNAWYRKSFLLACAICPGKSGAIDPLYAPALLAGMDASNTFLVERFLSAGLAEECPFINSLHISPPFETGKACCIFCPFSPL